MSGLVEIMPEHELRCKRGKRRFVCAIMPSGALMSEKPKEPFVPVETHDTVRHEIASELEEGPRSAKELSAAVRISEKEVYGHLEHIRKSIILSSRHLVITPAECKKCGFVFAKRERLKKPGKCPVCKGESIHAPLFEIREHA
jgi:predicted Zn-ribbon and HTH transcriptional regulator